jgi:peptide/nickel transport system substrate-binding protein
MTRKHFTSNKLSGIRPARRDFMKSGLAAGALATLAPWALSLAEAQPVAVPRDKTMTMVALGGRDGRWVDSELWNAYCVGANHQNGPNMIYEPLAYYSAIADKTYMWLAESYKFTPDSKQLTIKTRSGIKWSDGVPFSAEDVAYTLDTLRNYGPKVKWGVDVQQSVAKVTATDANTVVVDFLIPSPRFFFALMTYHYDIGVYIVPKHIFEGQDWTTFKHFDLDKGWPVSTGPWQVTSASLQQKVFDRRPTWWAAEAGLASMPQILRTIWLPNVAEQQVAQAVITNQIDCTNGIQPTTFPTIFQQNPKVITHTGRNKPFGVLDWYPWSLFVNTEVEPFNDRNVRWALSYYIDRNQVVDIAYAGAGQTSALPLPPFKPLEPYFAAVKDLLAKYNTMEVNPAKADALLTAKGYKKDSAGFWTDAKGERFRIEIIGYAATGAAVAPVVSQILRRHGIDASFSLPPDFDDRFDRGKFSGAIYGHGGSINEPYNTLRLYQGASIAVPGGHQVNFSRWKNAEFDKIVDEMSVTDPTDVAKLTEQWRRAMEIWLPDLPDIQLVQNFNRIAMNTTRWKNWPTEDNPYINGTPWHLTFPIVIWNLQST